MEENNTCICCGEVIPEGRMVCVNCEKKASETFQRLKNDFDYAASFFLPFKLKWYQRLWLIMSNSINNKILHKGK